MPFKNRQLGRAAVAADRGCEGRRDEAQSAKALPQQRGAVPGIRPAKKDALSRTNFQLSAGGHERKGFPQRVSAPAKTSGQLPFSGQSFTGTQGQFLDKLEQLGNDGMYAGRACHLVQPMLKS